MKVAAAILIYGLLVLASLAATIASVGLTVWVVVVVLRWMGVL